MILTEIKWYSVSAGVHISEAISKALEIAKRDKIIVKFEFNGVEMAIYEFSNKEDELKYFYKRMEYAKKD